MNQVHKENLTHVENAIPGRQGLEIEIFGMEGVPGEVVDQHNQQVTQKHFAEEAERQRLTGNPARGAFANGDALPNKRSRVHETLEDIERRAEKYRQDRINGVLPPPSTEVKSAVSDPTAQTAGMRECMTDRSTESSCRATLRRSSRRRNISLLTSSTGSPRRCIWRSTTRRCTRCLRLTPTTRLRCSSTRRVPTQWRARRRSNICIAG